MTNEQLKERICDIIAPYVSAYGDDERIADALIAAGYGYAKEIKYRVRRAEKALYIACRETAEIIFKDDFDRHAQEYMYGYLIQAEKELAEEDNNGN